MHRPRLVLSCQLDCEHVVACMPCTEPHDVVVICIAGVSVRMLWVYRALRAYSSSSPRHNSGIGCTVLEDSYRWLVRLITCIAVLMKEGQSNSLVSSCRRSASRSPWLLLSLVSAGTFGTCCLASATLTYRSTTRSDVDLNSKWGAW